ncbi:MAG: hypothetical protein ACKESB_02710 [Candidatus Hodgkinia cicadicola]
MCARVSVEGSARREEKWGIPALKAWRVAPSGAFETRLRIICEIQNGEPPLPLRAGVVVSVWGASEDDGIEVKRGGGKVR